MAEEIREEPPTGAVVAIDWGGHRQEVWVSNSANIGNWYTPDIPLSGRDHPHWEDVVNRAQGRTLTLLAAGDKDTYSAGYEAGLDAATTAVTNAIDDMRGRARD